MKVKLADGTEVEVADDSSLAVAAREIETAKGLGFDSIGAMTESQSAELDAMKKRNEEDQKFIDRQKNELGDLRKKTGTPAPDGDGDGTPEDDKETPELREERFRKQNSSVQTNLTDAERAHAEKEFLKQYEESTPEERALLKTHEGRNAFMGAVFPTKETDNASPVGLFEKPVAPKLTIGEQVAVALKKDDKGRSRRPVIPQSNGSGFTPMLDVKPVSKPAPVGAGRGGVRDALQFAKNNQGD